MTDIATTIKPPIPIEIKLTPISELMPAEYNPRKIDKLQLEALQRSIAEFGFIDPVIANKDGTVIGGHQRLEAAVRLKMALVPVIFLDITKQKEKALNLALNKIGGKFDEHLLADILAELPTEDRMLTGFSDKEAEKLIGKLLRDENEKEREEYAPPAPVTSTTKYGDRILLGDHVLLCGDATNIEDVKRLLDGQKAVLVVADPPYGVSVNKTNWIPGRKRGPAFDHKIENDDLRGDALQKFIRDSFTIASIVSIPEACFYSWSAPLEAGYNMLLGILEAGIHVQGQIVWVKPSLTLGQADYQWRHEICWYGYRKQKGVKHRWTGGRDQTTVWQESRERNGSHPTMKPVNLFVMPIHNHTSVGEIVYDPFGGSGPAMIACEKTERKCYMMEISESYCDVIVERWERFTGKKAQRPSGQ